MKALLVRLGPLAGFALVFAVFALRLPETFATADNLLTVSLHTVLVALGALGMTFVVAAGGIDLSIGSTLALSSVATALVLAHGGGVLLAAAAGVAVGALVGAANAVAIARLRIGPFLATLGTMGVARGLAKWLADERTVQAEPGWLPAWMTKYPDPAWLVLAPAVWLTLGLAAVLGVVLARTTFGVHTYAIGSSEANARLCGVPVAATTTKVFVLCGATAGLAGVLHFARLRVGDPMAGSGLELQVIAAVVLGGGSLAGGEGSIAGSLLGAFCMALLANGCQLAGMPNYVQEMLVGVIILVAAVLDRRRR